MIAPDIAAMSDALRTAANGFAAFDAYWTPLQSVVLHPQPVKLDGRVVGTYDPLDKHPDLVAALRAAQQHTVDFIASVRQPLTLWAVETLPDFNTRFQNDSATILTAIDGLGSPPDPMTRQKIEDALADLSSGLDDTRPPLAAVQAGVATAVQQFGADHAVLTGGDATLSTIIAQLEHDELNDLLSEAARFGGSLFVPLLQAIYDQIIGQCRALESNLGQAVACSSLLDQGVSAIANTLAILDGKYAEVVRKVDQASDAQLGSELQKLQVQVAASAWGQLTDFASKVFFP